jgi:hypothetical protein
MFKHRSPQTTQIATSQLYLIVGYKPRTSLDAKAACVTRSVREAVALGTTIQVTIVSRAL